jgi:AraC family transcriptional regulator, regulatory protein of adaptative response / DNA-3-methyladenine glycosylase II
MTTYSAVRTTGIYCRPGCGARPRAENVTTFELAATAEAAGYRACLKCRPYRMVGHVAPNAPELVCRAVQLIIAGALDHDDEAALGRRLAVSARHLRRMFAEHVGVTPSQLAHSRRAHFARRLLDDSDLTIAEIAFASGFGSVRHFNRAMRDVFRAAPRDLRKRRRRHDRLIADGGLTLRLPFEPPFEWEATLGYLSRRAIPGVESVEGGVYRRTIVLDGDPGMLELRAGGVDHMLLCAHLPYWEGLIHVVERAARMVGIDVDVTAGEAHLAPDPVLAAIIKRQVGLRVPGAWGPFEAGVQAIVSQTLDLASTRDGLATITRAYGTHVPGLPHDLTHVFPSADTIAESDLADWYLPRSIANAIIAFASAVATDAVRLDCSASLDELISSLLVIPGIEQNAAHQIALRLGYHDAFPYADPAVRRALRQVAHSVGAVEATADRWRPWRALAVTHLVAHIDSGVLGAEHPASSLGQQAAVGAWNGGGLAAPPPPLPTPLHTHL